MKDNQIKMHTSVLLDEAISALAVKQDGSYIDCTLGEAGHSLEILERLSDKGKLLSIDQDSEAILFVTSTHSNHLLDSRWKIVQGNYSHIRDLSKGFIDSADGVLMDLGISSRQLELEDRGFSYQKEDEMLDMRMDQSLNVTARDLLNVLSESELTKLFRVYGEEKFAYKIAKAIKSSTQPIERVGQLNALVNRAMPAASKSSNKHPARRVYQALRIAVNDELNSLKEALDSAFELLNRDGRLVVISFHSLEDRIVKSFFKDAVKSGKAVEVIEHPLEPSLDEVESNPRARSAKLRAIAKT